MKRLTALFMIVFFCISIAACGVKSMPKEITPGVVEVDGCRVEVYSYYEKAQELGTIGAVCIRFTNHSGVSCNLDDKVEIRAFQMGSACSYYFDSSLFDVDHLKNVSNGTTVETGIAFIVQKSLPIMVQIVAYGEVISTTSLMAEV